MEAKPENASLEFEREKWRADLELRQREIALKEREQANREAETELKRVEQASSKWRSPLVVAIFAAAVAAAGNALVAYLNANSQRDLEGRKQEAEIALERSKSESIRILEMIKTGDTEKAASNLEFLLKSGLVAEPERVTKLGQFLGSRKPGAGPSLPAPAGAARFEFEPTPALTKAVQESMEDNLSKYIVYLEAIGLKTDLKKASIRLDPTTSVAYHSDKNEIVVGPDTPASVIFTYFAIHALGQAHSPLLEVPRVPAQTQPLVILPALASYLTCSYLESIEDKNKPIDPQGRQTCARLQSKRAFAEFPPGEKEIPSDLSDVWTGLFWEMRTNAEPKMLDGLLVKTWIGVSWPRTVASRDLAIAFVEMLLKVTVRDAPDFESSLRATLTRRGFLVREKNSQ